MAERVRPDDVLDVVGEQEAVGGFAEEHIEVVGPEVGHHLIELTLRERGAHQHQILELSGEPSGRLFLGAWPACSLTFLLPFTPLLKAGDEYAGEVAPVKTKDIEPALALTECAIVDRLGVELSVQPAHDSRPDDAVDLAGTRPVSQPVERVQSRVACREWRDGAMALLAGAIAG